MLRKVVYSVIIPVYNEEAVVSESYRRLTAVMESVGKPYELLFVNDGSSDGTGAIIKKLGKTDERIRLLEFSRNFGHQIAITAGMDYAFGEAMVIIDADLQDPPELIPQMIAKWHEGYEVVYGKRTKREGESLFKKWSASLFYRVLRSLTEIDIPLDTGDFRLIDRKVCNAMQSIREKNRFVRGLISWMGFKQIAVEYVREERFAGETKYPLRKMLHFSVDAITAFSSKPLKLATYLGILITVASSIYLSISLGQVLFTGSQPTGWSSLIAVLILLDGLILIILGILGEYIGRVFDECRNRPLYVVHNQPVQAKAKPKEVKWNVVQ